VSFVRNADLPDWESKTAANPAKPVISNSCQRKRATGKPVAPAGEKEVPQRGPFQDFKMDQVLPVFRYCQLFGTGKLPAA